jgi:hypothetical protein
MRTKLRINEDNFMAQLEILLDHLFILIILRIREVEFETMTQQTTRNLINLTSILSFCIPSHIVLHTLQTLESVKYLDIVFDQRQVTGTNDKNSPLTADAFEYIFSFLK